VNDLQYQTIFMGFLKLLSSALIPDSCSRGKCLPAPERTQRSLAPVGSLFTQKIRLSITCRAFSRGSRINGDTVERCTPAAPRYLTKPRGPRAASCGDNASDSNSLQNPNLATLWHSEFGSLSLHRLSSLRSISLSPVRCCAFSPGCSCPTIFVQRAQNHRWTSTDGFKTTSLYLSATTRLALPSLPSPDMRAIKTVIISRSREPCIVRYTVYIVRYTVYIAILKM